MTVVEDCSGFPEGAVKTTFFIIILLKMGHYLICPEGRVIRFQALRDWLTTQGISVSWSLRLLWNEYQGRYVRYVSVK